jgi:hypothetical protein
VVSARTRSINSRCGRGWLALLARCLASLVILAGVALVFSGPALAQEPAPGGPAPTADPPIDAGIDRAKFEPFSKALRDVEVLESEVEDLTRRIVEAEAIVKFAEQGLSVKSLDTARSDLDTEKAELTKKQRKLKEARDKLEEERQKLSPDDRVDLAIVNLSERLWQDGVWVNEFLAGRTVYRTREEVPLGLGGGVPLTDVEHMQTQWALRKLGLPAAPPKEPLEPVVVAVIDSGLDYRHPHIRPESIWQNPHPGADPRFPDDRIGWNFVANDNRPWDDVGHGTFIAGLILALNPAAQIMPVKVLNPLGAGRASDVGRAIVYAVDRGARVVNVSLGSAGLTDLEQWAVDYARARGAVVVVASGNSGVDTAGFGPAGLTGVITVAALDQNDKRAGFANWGRHVSLAAPGVDIVSLRARGTDFVLVGTRGKNYTPGQNIVGADRWFFRASGTSFSAPFVAGAASLLLSRDPNLTGRQVERMLVESAEDVDTAGWDPLTGAGRLDIGRALQIDPNDYVQAAVHKVAPARVGGQAVIQVFGTAIGRRLDRYEIQLGQGAEPARWTTIATERGRQVDGELLGAFPPRTLTAKGRWTVRVVVHDERGKTRESRIPLNVQ